jgi:cytochrome c556
MAALGLAGVSADMAVAQVTVPPDTLIIARQAGMDLQLALAGAVKRGIDSKGEVKVFKDAGDGFAAWGKAIPGLFVKGSESGHNTRALPVIWSDRDGFEKAAASLSDAGEALSKAAAAGNTEGVASAFQAVGAACSACHRTYRAR